MEGVSITELEIRQVVRKNVEEAFDDVFFFFRSHSFIEHVPKIHLHGLQCEGKEQATRLRNLKSFIYARKFGVFDNYPCEWGGFRDGKCIVEGLRVFGERAVCVLWDAIDRKYPAIAMGSIEEENPINRIIYENLEHEAFADAHRALFIGREKTLSSLLDCVSLNDVSSEAKGITKNISGAPIIVHGPDGVGKTSLMACLVYRLQQRGISCLQHFCDATPNSAKLQKLLYRLCWNLSNFSSHSAPQETDDYSSLVMRTGQLLSAACQSISPLVLVFDALERVYLEEASVKTNVLFEWLPRPLPKNCYVFITCATHGIIYRALRSQDKYKGNVALEILVPTLSSAEKVALVRHRMEIYGKTLTESGFDNQMSTLTMKREAGNPLYLSLACDEIRRFGVYEHLYERLKLLPGSLMELLSSCMKRLEKEVGIKYLRIVVCVMICLQRSIRILGFQPSDFSETDLLYISSLVLEVSDGNIVLNSYKLTSSDLNKCSARLPSAVLSRILYGMSPVLSKSGVSDTGLFLSSGKVSSLLHDLYLRNDEKLERIMHQCIAAYCLKIMENCEAPRSFIYCFPIVHLYMVKAWKELCEIICSLHYIYGKAVSGHASELLDPFILLENSAKSMHSSRILRDIIASSNFLDYFSFLRNNMHFIVSHAFSVWQQAMLEPMTSVVRMCADVEVPLVFENVAQSLSLPLVTFRKDSILPSADSNDNTLSFSLTCPSPVTCVSMMSDGTRFALGHADGSVSVHCAESGKAQFNFVGHVGFVSCVVFIGSDKLCSTSLDGSASLWSLTEKKRLASFLGHEKAVSCCAVNSDNQVVATSGLDGRVLTFHAKDGDVSQFVSVPRQDCPVGALTFHPRLNVLALGCWDGSVVLYNCDYFPARRLAKIPAHSESIRDVVFTASGDYLVSGSSCGSLKVWLMTDNVSNCLDTLKYSSKEPNDAITSLSSSADCLAFASADGSTRIWWLKNSSLCFSAEERNVEVLQDHVKGVLMVRAFQLVASTATMKAPVVVIQVGVEGKVTVRKLSFPTASVKLDVAVSALDVSSNGRWIAIARRNGAVSILDARDENKEDVMLSKNCSRSVCALHFEKQELLCFLSDYRVQVCKLDKDGYWMPSFLAKIDITSDFTRLSFGLCSVHAISLNSFILNSHLHSTMCIRTNSRSFQLQSTKTHHPFSKFRDAEFLEAFLRAQRDYPLKVNEMKHEFLTSTLYKSNDSPDPYLCCTSGGLVLCPSKAYAIRAHTDVISVVPITLKGSHGETHSLFVTGSFDGTVKVWCLEKFSQIGMYNHPCPLTTIKSAKMDDLTALVLGDARGGITFMRLCLQDFSQ